MRIFSAQLYTVICGLPRSTIFFPHDLIHSTIFGKKSYWTQNMFWFFNKERPTWCHLLYYFTVYCSTCFGCKYIHPQELATYLLSYFMGCIALVRCVFGVTVWFGWGGVVSVCRLVCWCYHTTPPHTTAPHPTPHHTTPPQTTPQHPKPHTTPPQPNHNVTPTHIEPEQYNPWNNSSNKSQALEDGCINIRNMLSSK